jgi:hypothetical protein
MGGARRRYGRAFDPLGMAVLEAPLASVQASIST